MDALECGQDEALKQVIAYLIEHKFVATEQEVRSRLKEITTFGIFQTPCDQTYQINLGSTVHPQFPDDGILINLECDCCRGDHNWVFKRVSIIMYRQGDARVMAFQMYPDGGCEIVRNGLFSHQHQRKIA